MSNEDELLRQVAAALLESRRPPDAIARAYASQPNKSKLLETRSVRDEREEFDDGDGWSCIPVPPDDDPSWFIVDSSHDYMRIGGKPNRI
jgi:hypothetical protein